MDPPGPCRQRAGVEARTLPNLLVAEWNSSMTVTPWVAAARGPAARPQRRAARVPWTLHLGAGGSHHPSFERCRCVHGAPKASSCGRAKGHPRRKGPPSPLVGAGSAQAGECGQSRRLSRCRRPIDRCAGSSCRVRVPLLVERERPAPGRRDPRRRGLRGRRPVRAGRRRDRAAALAPPRARGDRAALTPATVSERVVAANVVDDPGIFPDNLQRRLAWRGLGALP